MPINPGSSVFGAADSAIPAMDAAGETNPRKITPVPGKTANSPNRHPVGSLHDVLRAEKIKPAFSARTGAEGDFAKEGERSREYIRPGTHENEGPSAHVVIHTNPKTHKVRHEVSPMSESGYPEQMFGRTSKSLTRNLAKANKNYKEEENY